MILKLNNTIKVTAITFLANLYFYNHIGTLYLQTRGLSLFQVGSIASVVIITIFLSEVPTGILADKIGRKWSVVIALVLQAAGEWLYLFASNYIVFILIAILAGIGFAFLSGANEALVYDTLRGKDKDKQMKRAWGLVSGASQLAFFIAPLAGSFLVTSLSLAEFRKVILLTAISVSCALVLSLSLKEPKLDYHHKEEGPLYLLKMGFGEIRSSKILRRILLISTFTTAFSGLLVSFYQPHFITNGVPVFWVGAGLAFGGLFSAILQAFAYKFEELIGKGLALFFLSLTPGLLYIVFGLVGVPSVLIPLFIVTYGFTDAKNPLLSSYKNQLMKSRTRATVLSLINMINSLYIAIVGLLIGVVANRSLTLAFIMIGSIILASTIALRVYMLPEQVQKSVDSQIVR